MCNTASEISDVVFVLLQLWEKAQSLPLPAMSKDAPENSPIFFLHGVGFGLVCLLAFIYSQVMCLQNLYLERFCLYTPQPVHRVGEVVML